MGILEILLIIAIVLKWLGLAFVATSWWTIFGIYVGTVVALVFVIFSVWAMADKL